MFKVRSELCVACGRCAMACPREAISLPLGYAQIDQSKCNECGRCVDACSQGAIVEYAYTPMSKEELNQTVSNLKSRTDELMKRLEAMKG
ncbi:MAG: 4Fe-4S binding protein [Dehalococcoidia bacterium]